MTSPATDSGIGTAIAASGATQTLSVSVPSNGDFLVIVAACSAVANSGPPTVNGVAAVGLAFAPLPSGSILKANVAGQFANQDMRFEVWSAPVAASGTYSVAVTWSAAPVCYGILAMPIKGVFSLTDAFDASPPASAASASTNAVVTYSTTQPDDLLIFINVFPQGHPSTGVPTGFSSYLTPGGVLGAGNVSLFNVAYTKSVSAAQTAQTAQDGTGSTFGDLAMVIALTADAKGIALQTFVTIICS